MTRPDITYIINQLESYTANPSLQHVTALKHILHYLTGTKDHRITYKDIQRHPDSFYGHTDAAYTNANDRKSTSGYVFLANGAAITWKSKKQTTTALSSTEAEYITLSEAAQEAIWLRSLYEELGIPLKYATKIMGDNEGAISMTKEARFHQRAIHINIRWHSIRELTAKGTIGVQSCHNYQQTTDMLTKAIA